VKEIYRYYSDTEVYKTMTKIKCPYCNEEWSEVGADECEKTYELTCDECENTFLMHFDVD